MTKIRWTYSPLSTLFAEATLQIWAIVSGGKGPTGVPNYAIAYRNSGSGVESGAVVLNSANATGTSLQEYFGEFRIAGTAKFPISNNLRADWQICDQSPPPAGPFDEMQLFRKDHGSSQYLFTNSYPFCRYLSGAWNYWSSSFPAVVFDKKDETGLDSERPAPSVYNVAPPGFTCSSYSNARFFVGTTSEYQFSEYKFPMRFDLSVDVNAYDRSGGGYRFASETPQSFFYLVGDDDLDRIAMSTDKATYSLAGLDTYSLMRPGRISQFGSKSPKSFVTRRAVTCFLDDARHFRMQPEQPDMESFSFAMKDILDQIPTGRVKNVVGATFDDRYYLFYTPSGGSFNTNAFVFDALSSTLTKDDYGSAGIVSTIVIASKLLALMSDGTIKQLEAGTSNVNISLVSREIGTDGESWQAGRQRVYCDDANSTLTVGWKAFKSGLTTSDSFSADAAGTDVRTDRWSSLTKSLRARSIQLSLSGSVPGGTRLYAWDVEQEDRVSEGD